MKLKIKYFNNAKRLEKISKGNWIDVYANEDVFVIKNQSKTIPLGFALELPEGWEGHLAPRSSTFKKWGVIQTNSVGVIDNSYCGDNDIIKMPVYATRDIVIPRNERIAKFRIVKNQPTLNIKYVTKMEDKDRGGFGSSNKQ